MLNSLKTKPWKARCYKISHYSLSDISSFVSSGGNKSIKKWTWSKSELQIYVSEQLENIQYQFIGYTSTDTNSKDSTLYAMIPLEILMNRLNTEQLKLVCSIHGINVWQRKYISLSNIQKLHKEHDCKMQTCQTCYCIFQPKDTLVPVKGADQIAKVIEQKPEYKVNDQNQARRGVAFPPPPSEKLMEWNIQNYCSDIQFENLKETKCRVCRPLASKKNDLLAGYKS